MGTNQNQAEQIRQPVIETSTDALPSSLTFFMSAGQRTLLLRALRKGAKDRTTALLTALDLIQLDPGEAGAHRNRQ